NLKSRFAGMVNLCLLGRGCGRNPGFFVTLPGRNSNERTPGRVKGQARNTHGCQAAGQGAREICGARFRQTWHSGNARRNTSPTGGSTMSNGFKTLDELDLTGKRVLLRADLNVPVADGKVSDATRIERLVPTIREIVKKDGKAILLSHFGRPKGKVDPEFSLEQVCEA